MNCEEAEDLLGAWALDALTDDERGEMAAHLRSCARHAAAAADWRATAARLAATADVVAPPPALRSRVLQAIAATPQDGVARPVLAGAIPRAGDQQRRRPPPVAAARRRFFELRPAAWAAVAAVLVAAVIGLGAWNAVLQRRSGADVGRLATRASSVSALRMNGTQNAGVVVYYANEKKALIVTDGLPALNAATQTYQLWAISGGRARSLGLLPAPVGGSSVAVVPFDAGSAQRIAVTVEPPGGSAQPTTPPVLVADV
ncbi:MAG: anti-sigma factor [Dehalococcoidia bacterium]|nr:anti-sigma factor [Dehalococcoidia bacterium]